MQAETEVKANGQDKDVAIQADGLYPFDASEIMFEIPRGGSLLSVWFQKPEEDDYLDAEAAAGGTSQVVHGEVVDQKKTTEEGEVIEKFYDKLVLRASRRLKGAATLFREYDQEECKKFPYAVKEALVQEIQLPNFKVLSEADDLLEQSGPLKVRQTVGDEDDPSYVIDYEIAGLSKAQQRAFKNAVRVKPKYGKRGKVTLHTELFTIKEAKKIFAPNLISLEGGMVEGQPFTAERKEEFLKQIDLVFQVGCVNALAEYYQSGALRD